MADLLFTERKPFHILVGAGVLAGLYFTSHVNYLFFHSIVEIFSIVIACGIFMVAWNSRRFQGNGYLLFIGIAYLFVAQLDLLHILTYKGIGIFPNVGANIPTQLWIAARYLQAIALLAAPLFATRRLKPGLTVACFAAAVAMLFAVIFIWPIFPDCFVEGRGLTPFKKVSEYLISLLLLAAFIFLHRQRRYFDKDVASILVASIFILIPAELSLTLYKDPFGFFNMAGHFLKLISFYLIYKAIIETGLARPYDLLFRELKVSEERYRHLYHDTPVMLHSIDQEGKLIDVSDYWLELLGYERNDVIGRKSTDFLTRESRRYAEEVVLPEYFRQGFCKDIPYQMVKKNGEVIDVLLSAVAECDDSGSHSLAVIIDVTKRKELEMALRQSEEKFAKAFRSAPVAITITTLTDGRYVEVNDEFERLSGYRRDEVLGRTTIEHSIWADPEERARITKMLRKQGEVRDLEINFRSKSGTDIIGLYSAELLEISGELSLISLVIDITARKRAAEELNIRDAHLAMRAQELEIANQELETFSYTVSHDLRKPLTTINAYCQVIMELCAAGMDESCKEYVRGIHNGVMNMNDLINTLLNFSRLTRSEIVPAETDLSCMARDIAAELKLAAPEHPATFAIAEGVTGRCDAKLLRVVLENLLGNAWKYTAAQDSARIEFGVTDVAGGKTYFVRDNGPGFDMAHTEQLFLPFHRLPGSSACNGFGVGLATVQRIIQRHGGRVWAEGEPGKGATFYFTL
jgi:PAS domain S-box-containing protein